MKIIIIPKTLKYVNRMSFRWLWEVLVSSQFLLSSFHFTLNYKNERTTSKVLTFNCCSCLSHRTKSLMYSISTKYTKTHLHTLPNQIAWDDSRLVLLSLTCTEHNAESNPTPISFKNWSLSCCLIGRLLDWQLLSRTVHQGPSLLSTHKK